jgi:DNA-binding response OmpR family regulator
MKVLIHDERTDALNFFRESIINRGYRVGIAKNGAEVMSMLSSEQYEIVLTNGGYVELNPDQLLQLRSSCVFIINITDGTILDQGPGLKADMELRRPFESWKLLRAIARGKAADS